MNGERGGMGGLMRDRLRRADRRDLAIGGWTILGVGVVVTAVNALSALADHPDVRAWEPWVWELSSLVMLALLLWIPWLATALGPPLEDGRAGGSGRLRLAALHVGALLLYSALHVGGFVLLRHLAYDAFGAGPYRFDALGTAPGRFLYELRKDALSYATFVAVFTGVAWLRQRRVGAVGPGTFDIREGSRLIRVTRDQILAVSSAGNYVEFRLADGRRPLMRATLAAIEADLVGFGFVRTHRSWLVNAGQVSGLRPDGSGDWTAELGALEIPVSRRFPQARERLQQGPRTHRS